MEIQDFKSKYIILCDGYFYNGGYSTIALYLFNNLKSINSINVELYNFIISKGPKLSKMENIGKTEINLCDIYKNTTKIIDKMNTLFKSNNSYTIICTSPWSFYLSSLFFKDNKTIYIKGGGIKGKANKKFEPFYILNQNVDLYIDDLTAKLENNAIINISNYYILPTIDIMYNILMKTQIIKFDKNKILKPVNFMCFDNSIILNDIQKQYDLIFVVSNHNRIIKNSSFAYKIFEKFPHLNKIVIGLNCDHYKKIQNTKVVNNIISNNELITYFKKSKIYIIPSYFDTGPATLVEALLNGCVPICYHNCGLGQLSINGCYTMNNLLIDLWICQINNFLNDFNKLDLVKYSNDLKLLIHRDKKRFVDFLLPLKNV